MIITLIITFIFAFGLFVSYMLWRLDQHTEQEIERHIQEAMNIANRWCRCADPGEITINHGTHKCTPKEHA